MKAGFVVVLAVALAVPASATVPSLTMTASDPLPSATASAYAKDVLFRYEAAVDGAYPEGHWFELTPENGSRVPYGFDGYSIPVAWEIPGDPRSQTGREPAWTSEGQSLRFSEPNGDWTTVSIRDDATYVVDASDGGHLEFGDASAPENFTEADFTRCTDPKDGGGCARYANDTRFSSIHFLAMEPGRYAITHTMTDVDGGIRVHETVFDVVGRVTSAPRELVAIPSAEDGPMLTWGVPEDMGGSDVLFYAVYRDAGDGAELVAYVASTSFHDGPLEDGTYTYTVTAYNRYGESEHSNAAVAAVADPADGGVVVTIDLLGIQETVAVDL